MAIVLAYNTIFKITIPILSFGLAVNLLPAQKAPLPFGSVSPYNTTTSNNYTINNAIVSPVITKDNNSLQATIRGFESDGMFTTKNKHIGFALKLINTLKESQVGNIVFKIASSTGSVLYTENIPLSINKKGSYDRDFEFANGQLQPGFYTASLDINTNRYSNILNYNFGYEADKSAIRTQIPIDFISFWENAKRELSSINPNYQTYPRPDLSTRSNNVYEIEFVSIAKAVIRGYLSVPKSGNRHGVLYKICDYLTELKPELRKDLAVFALNVRGVGSSAPNYAFPYDSYGINNADDKNKYILKGVYLDAVRGLEFLHSQASTFKLDNNKIIASGSGLGASAAVAVAVLDQRLRGVALETPTFVGMREMLSFADALGNNTWPSSMFKSFCTNRRFGKENLLRTLDYFDPVSFAPFVNCAVLTGFNLRSTATPVQSVYSFINNLRVDKKETHVCKECSSGMDRTFYGLRETWIRERLKRP